MTKKLWMRLGDGGDYEDFDDPFSAGERVGYVYEQSDWKSPDVLVSWRSKGATVSPGFEGDNYISLFWGDNDAQPIGKGDMTHAERAEFVQGLWEGAGWASGRRAAKHSAKPKPKRKSRSSPSGSSGMTRLSR